MFIRGIWVDEAVLLSTIEIKVVMLQDDIKRLRRIVCILIQLPFAFFSKYSGKERELRFFFRYIVAGIKNTNNAVKILLFA